MKLDLDAIELAANETTTPDAFLSVGQVLELVKRARQLEAWRKALGAAVDESNAIAEGRSDIGGNRGSRAGIDYAFGRLQGSVLVFAGGNVEMPREVP